MKRFALASLVVTLIGAAAGPSAAGDGPQLTPYGFVRLDVIFDDSRLSHPQFPFHVLSEPPGSDDDSELSIHPRLTRIGMRLEPLAVGSDTKSSGTIEIDFQNGGSESRAAVRMRHAFAAIKSGAWELLFGQTWDLIAPLYPAANNDGLMWNAGNLGDRRPQVRFTLRPHRDGGAVRLAVAAGMPGAVNSQDLDGNGQLDGLDAAVPNLQALAEMESDRILAGVWGHWARDRVTVADEKRDYDGASVGGHVRIKASSQVAFQGEGFWAQNASDVRGGIGQGINLADDREIRTAGGWGEVEIKAGARYTITGGATIDKPKEKDLVDGARSQNTALYLVQKIRPWDRVTLGIEYLFWRTQYLEAPDGDANRLDTHLTFSF